MKKNNIAIINEDYLKDRIYIIRNQKVMLDSDLARIYGYTISAFNQQVQRNIEKFDEDFMFQLTKEETIHVKSQNVISREINVFKGQNGGIRKSSFVFTEQGVYMLMTVLKGELATKQSKALIKLFKSMKDHIIENSNLIPYEYLEMRTTNLEKNYKEIRIDLKKVMKNFNDPNTYKHFLILDGKKIEADSAYIKIIKLAKKSIFYFDDYIDIKTLDLLSNVRKDVEIVIFSDNKSSKSLKEYMINDFMIQNPTNKIKLLKTNNKCHDRYIIIDYNTNNEMIFHSGASLKDAGNKITTITKIEDSYLYKPMIKKMLKMSSLRLC